MTMVTLTADERAVMFGR